MGTQISNKAVKYVIYDIVSKGGMFINLNSISIDMIRLKARVDVETWDKLAQKVVMDPEVYSWVDNRIQFYRYNHVYRKGEKGSFYFAYRHNSEKCMRKFSLVVEFNPNKCLVDGYLRELLLMLGKNYIVVSADVAYDFMGLDIRDVILEKSMKKRVMVLSYGGDDMTYYVGLGNGRVKVYNKAKEEGMEGIKWTRFEVSWQINMARNMLPLWEVSENGPKIYTYSQRSIVEDKTLRALLYAVEQGYPVNELTRSYKKKVLELLESRTEINIDYLKGKEVLIKTIEEIEGKVYA